MKKRMNLYQKYKRSSDKQKSMSRGGIWGIIAVASILLMIATGVRFTIEKMMIKSEIDQMRNFVENPSNIEKYEASKVISDESKKIDDFNDKLGEINGIFAEKDAIGSNILREIHLAKPGTVTITNMTASSAHITLSYTSKDAKGSSDFIKGLKERSIIKDVQYDGYQYDESSGNYTGSAKLILRGNF